jgi:antibiotic biosynthesis monooxygenase (ABM) superfamily enzyme
MSTILLFTSDDIAIFAVFYSIGQVLNIGASMFLSTPKGQWKAMTNKSRLVTSIVYILSIILTLVIALATQIKGLVIVFLIIQVCAYYWYTISFIPFGQKLAKGCLKSCCA